jgi:hypothetical protein
MNRVLRSARCRRQSIHQSRCSASSRSAAIPEFTGTRFHSRVYQFTADGDLVITSANPVEHWAVTWKHY